MKDDIREIEISKISPNRRIVYSDQSLEVIEREIRKGGQAPILVRFEHDSFRILDGEKRWRVCKRLGMTTIRALIVR